MLEKLLKSKKCFKLVLGAGNEDTKSIEKLMKVWNKHYTREDERVLNIGNYAYNDFQWLETKKKQQCQILVRMWGNTNCHA